MKATKCMVSVYMLFMSNGLKQPLLATFRVLLYSTIRGVTDVELSLELSGSYVE